MSGQAFSVRSEAIISESFFTLLFVFLLISSCTSEQEEKAAENEAFIDNISVAKQGELNLHNATGDDFTFGKLKNQFAVDQNASRFAFWDASQKEMLLTNSDGEIIAQNGGSGRGPEEFQQVNKFGFGAEGKLYVLDNSMRKLNTYDQNLEYQESKRISFSANDMYPHGMGMIIHNERLLVPILEQQYAAQENWWRSTLIAYIDLVNGDVNNTFGQYDSLLTESKVYWNNPIVGVDSENGYLLSTHQSLNEIQVFNLENDSLIGHISADRSTNFSQPENEISPNRDHSETTKKSIGLSFTRGVYATDDYIILFYGNLTEEFVKTRNVMDRNYFISLFDKADYSYLGDKKLKYPLGAVDNDKLYLIENKNPNDYTVGIYELNKKN